MDEAVPAILGLLKAPASAHGVSAPFDWVAGAAC
jgi:hypothetical protein